MFKISFLKSLRSFRNWEFLITNIMHDASNVPMSLLTLFVASDANLYLVLVESFICEYVVHVLRNIFDVTQERLTVHNKDHSPA